MYKIKNKFNELAGPAGQIKMGSSVKNSMKSMSEEEEDNNNVRSSAVGSSKDPELG